MAELTKTAIEKTGKAIEMDRIMGALTDAGIDVERVTDNGTLAYMIKDGALEGRFITIKVVLTKELDETSGKGFDIAEGIAEFELKVKAELDREAERVKKATEKSAKKAKADKVKVDPKVDTAE